MAEQRPVVMTRRAGPGAVRPPATTAMTPKEVMSVLRRHLGKIILLTIVGFALGGLAWYGLKQYMPKYTAETYIEVMPPGETDPMDIKPQLMQKDILYGYRLSMANLIKQQTMLQRLIERDYVQRSSWFTDDMGKDVRKAMRDLEKNLGVFAMREAEYVRVSMTCAKSSESAKIVDEIVNLFIANQTTGKVREVGEKLQQLEKRRVALERDVDTADKGLDEVRTAWGLTDLDEVRSRYERHYIVARLEDLELEQNDLKLALRQLGADIKNLERIATGPITVQVEHAIESDPVVILLAQNLAFYEANLQSKLSRFGENHREVRTVKEALEKIKEEKLARELEIAEELRRSNLANARDSYVVLEERYKQLEDLRAEAQSQKRDLDLARVQYEQRKGVRDERFEMLTEIKGQIEKLRIIADDPETPKVRKVVAETPEPLYQVFSRQWYLHFPVGTMLGFALGLALAFTLELMDDTVRKPRDIARYLQVPLLGVIPDASADRQLRGVELAHAVQQAPGSLVSEAYRRCRANLELSGEASPKTILVAGGNAADGTTSVAVNMASTFIAENKKVLLIDANFRRPSLQSLFPGYAGSGNAGLSSVLLGKCGLKQAVRASGQVGLDIIDAGPMVANPSELLGSAKMRDVLKELAKSYDQIVIDGPPILLVSDSKMLARSVEATVLVVNADTHRGAAMRVVGEMQAVGASIAGCVLFGAEHIKGGYFNEQYKSYKKYAKVQLAGAGPVASVAPMPVDELDEPEEPEA